MPFRGWAWHSKCSPGPSWAPYCATGVCEWPACWWLRWLVFEPWAPLNLLAALSFTCEHTTTLVDINNQHFSYIIADTVNALSDGQLEKLLGKSQSQWLVSRQARTVKNTLVTHIYVREVYVLEGFSSLYRTAQNVVAHIICQMFFWRYGSVVTTICMYLICVICSITYTLYNFSSSPSQSEWNFVGLPSLWKF